MVVWHKHLPGSSPYPSQRPHHALLTGPEVRSAKALVLKIVVRRKPSNIRRRQCVVIPGCISADAVVDLHSFLARCSCSHTFFIRGTETLRIEVMSVANLGLFSGAIRGEVEEFLNRAAELSQSAVWYTLLPLRVGSHRAARGLFMWIKCL